MFPPSMPGGAGVLMMTAKKMKGRKMRKATKKELKAFGAVLPGYPVGAGVALVPEATKKAVKSAAWSAGFDVVPVRGAGYDANYNGYLCLFRSYRHRSGRYRYHVGGGEYWSRSDFARHFDGSRALFSYCWRRFLKCGGAAAADDISAFLDDVAAEAVNNEKSPFYIYG